MLVSPKIGVAMLPRSPAWLSFSSQERITWVQRKSPTIHNYPTSDVTGIGWNGSYRTIVSTILTKHCCHKTVGRKESEAWTPHLAPCSTWTKIWGFCLIFVCSRKIRFDDFCVVFIERKESNLIRVEVPPGSKAVLTGVPHGMNMEPMKSRLESSDPPVDPYVCSQASNNVGPLGAVGGLLQKNLSILTCSMYRVPDTPLLDSRLTWALVIPITSSPRAFAGNPWPYRPWRYTYGPDRTPPANITKEVASLR